MVQPTANTELTIAFIRILESVMCLLCLITHINSVKDEEPMPHIVLFCGTFGGFFILSLAKLVVPLSGQLSPPGVDLVFSFMGFILFYMAACAAMFFVQRDPHLIAKNGQSSSISEESHPFFQQGVNHAILSISTGTLFLMHAVISADRLTSILKGIEEDIEREIDENDIDIFPEDTISLHLFFLNWLILIWNTVCCKSIRKLLRKCQLRCIQYYRRKRPPSYIPRRRRHRRAKILTELTRMHGITVSNIAPQEFIRNPRRSLAHNNVLAFIENENNFNRTMSINNDEIPQQGPSSQLQTRTKTKPKNVVWRSKEKSIMDMQDVDYESGEGEIDLPDSNQTRTALRGSTSSMNESREDRKSTSSVNSIESYRGNSDEDLDIGVAYIRNEEFGSDEDILQTPKKKLKEANTVRTSNDDLSNTSNRERSISFIRNEAFESDDVESIMMQSKSMDMAARSKPKPKRQRRMSFVRNKDFDSEGETKLSKIFKWFPRKSEDVEQNVNKGTIRRMEIISSKSIFGLAPTETLQVIDSRANSEVEISSFSFGVKSKDSNLSERKASPTQLQIPIPIPILKNQEVAQFTTIESNFVSSNTKSYDIPDTDIILPKKESLTVLQHQKQGNENTPSLFNSNLIPYILTSTINKGLEITLDDEVAKTEQKATFQALESTSTMQEVTGLITEITLEPQTNTEDNYRNIFPILDSTSYMKEVASLIPSVGISESTSKKENEEIEYQSTFPALDSTSYMKEVASLIPSNAISESKSRKEEKKAEYQTNFPELDSTSYLHRTARLIPPNKNTENLTFSIKEEKKKKSREDAKNEK